MLLSYNISFIPPTKNPSLNEYRKYIEKDSALERRFQPITVNEPNEEDTIKKARITYEYNTIMPDSEVDGVGTGTDGTTNDTHIDEDGLVDGIIGETIEDIIKGMSNMILDITGIKDRHNYIQSNYGNIPGFSVGTTTVSP